MCLNLGRMRTLVLMRHAKSDYPDGVADYDRPLAPRGVLEAGLAGAWLHENLSGIDAVLCSSAVRTRQTLERTGIQAPVDYRDRLYGAKPGSMINEINQVAGDPDTLLVIGHEPTVSQVAVGLADRPVSDRKALERIASKFPTSGIAVLRIPEPWADLTLAGAALIRFHIPR